MDEKLQKQSLAADYPNHVFSCSVVLRADCFEWLQRSAEASVHAVVTDPPYGVKEYDADQLMKRANGNGGIWRIPPSFDGHERSPLPRFTALNPQERSRLQLFFRDWAGLVLKVLLPGGHLFMASNTFLSQLVFQAVVESGFEYRGQIVRLVQTLRGGDRPKNAEEVYPDVCSLPRGRFEPWGLFRKPMPPRATVQDCLREFKTGGLRRKLDGRPFEDVIESERTPQRERQIAKHPSLKPQSFLRQIVYASLPLGEGVVVDPFMGSGSTVAAAEANNYACIGIERHEEFFDLSKTAIPGLASIRVKDVQLDLLPTH